MNRRLIPLTSFVALVLTLPTGAETFFDQARVIDVQPVYKLRQLPVQVEKCGFEQPESAASVDPRSLGDARAADPGIDLLGAMQREAALRAPPEKVYRCRTVTETHSAKELSGYRVRYEYAGHIHERKMHERPGDTIGVAVSMGQGTASTRVAQWR